MRMWLARIAHRLAPRTMKNLTELNSASEQVREFGPVLPSLQSRVEELEAELSELKSVRDEVRNLAAVTLSVEARAQAREELMTELRTAVDDLREEIDESRRDGRRVAELYDLVFERLRGGQV